MVHEIGFTALRYIVYLVGGFSHLEKYESQWEGLSPCIMEKNG